MIKFLIVMPLVDEHAHLFEKIIGTAESFLRLHGGVDRSDMSSHVRVCRKGKARETLNLVELTARCEAGMPDAVALATALEGVIRASLASAGVGAADARVFAA